MDMHRLGAAAILFIAALAGCTATKQESDEAYVHRLFQEWANHLGVTNVYLDQITDSMANHDWTAVQLAAGRIAGEALNFQTAINGSAYSTASSEASRVRGLMVTFGATEADWGNAMAACAMERGNGSEGPACHREEGMRTDMDLARADLHAEGVRWGILSQ